MTDDGRRTTGEEQPGATGVKGKARHSETHFEGKVWKFDDDINTDLLMPMVAVFAPRAEQRKYCMSANRPGWVDQVQPGDILVGGKNFGTGSGRAA